MNIILSTCQQQDYSRDRGRRFNPDNSETLCCCCKISDCIADSFFLHYKQMEVLYTTTVFTEITLHSTQSRSTSCALDIYCLCFMGKYVSILNAPWKRASSGTFKAPRVPVPLK